VVVDEDSRGKVLHAYFVNTASDIEALIKILKQLPKPTGPLITLAPNKSTLLIIKSHTGVIHEITISGVYLIDETGTAFSDEEGKVSQRSIGHALLRKWIASIRNQFNG